jgi:hypothetical protein
MQQDLARGGERDAARGAVDEGDAEFLFDLDDVLGQRGLGHAQALRGRRKRALLRDGDEIAQLLDVHSALPWR